MFPSLRYHCDGSQPRGTSRAPFVCGAAQSDQRPAAERISSLAYPVHTSSSSTTTDRATHSESNIPKTLTRVFPTQPTGCNMEGHFRNRKWADPVTSSASMLAVTCVELGLGPRHGGSSTGVLETCAGENAGGSPKSYGSSRQQQW